MGFKCLQRTGHVSPTCPVNVYMKVMWKSVTIDNCPVVSGLFESFFSFLSFLTLTLSFSLHIVDRNVSNLIVRAHSLSVTVVLFF